MLKSSSILFMVTGQKYSCYFYHLPNPRMHRLPPVIVIVTCGETVRKCKLCAMLFSVQKLRWWVFYCILQSLLDDSLDNTQINDSAALELTSSEENWAPEHLCPVFLTWQTLIHSWQSIWNCQVIELALLKLVLILKAAATLYRESSSRLFWHCHDSYLYKKKLSLQPSVHAMKYSLILKTEHKRLI